MIEFVQKLFDSTGFTPRRYCGVWATGEILLHNISDGIIWFSYMAIPVVLIYFVRKKRGAVPFPKMFWMFGAFIILCGFTHLVEIVMFYRPAYHFAGLLKAVTATVSLITAIALVPLVPKALAMRTPEELEREIAERKRSEKQLTVIHKQLLETSRLAGMAEVASSVLHNVGNVLNSVNISSTVMSDNVRNSKLANLSKVAGMIREHRNDLATFLTSDPKGKQLPDYLNQLAEHLGTEQKSTLCELESLSKNIEHIKDIVTMQQSYARASSIEEALEVTDLVEDALRMNEGALVRHDVRVVREYAQMPPLRADKHKVLQILVNLIRNAKYALDEGGRSDKRLTVRVRMNGQDRVQMEVDDDGIGIAPEIMPRIFEHGFTTRKEGHGFGLHGSILTAKGMGGSLNVRSDGLGKGAAFTLELPLSGSNGSSHQDDNRERPQDFETSENIDKEQYAKA